MKLFVVVLLALAAQTYARSASLEQNEHMQSGNYNVQKKLNDLLESIMLASISHWQSSTAAMRDASSFKSKITHRINNSPVLAGDSVTQQKLYKIAEDKLKKCEKPSGQELDKQCVDRAVGQVMQLIAAVENGSHRAQV